MKYYLRFAMVPLLFLNAILYAGERGPLADTVDALKIALSSDKTPQPTTQEFISMAIVAIAAGKIGFDVSKNFCLIGRVFSTLIPATTGFIALGTSTETGRFMRAQHALGNDILNTLYNTHKPLPDLLKERVKTTQGALRPTHWISEKYLAPLLTETT